MISSRFIDVPSVALLAEINAIGAAVAKSGGQHLELAAAGKEIVHALRPPKSRAEVRIYTSIARGAASARGCGDDAIRLFWGARFYPEILGQPDRFKPLCKAVRVFRTAPKGEPEARLTAFLGRFRRAVREVYRAALRAPSCPLCSAPMVERAGGNGVFLGCTGYPSCRGSRPLTPFKLDVKLSGPATGHEVVALYGMPHGEMAAEQVQDGLDAEADADPLGHTMYEGGSAFAQSIIRGDRARRRFGR